MRQKIVAGNWKCNTTLQEGIELAKAVDAIVAKEGAKDVVVVLGTPFTHITKVVETVDAGRIGVAAQNCAAEAKGAFTGEVSADMIKSTGANYVILGHSERREYYGETSEILNKKVALALKSGLTPIFCCGEALAIRQDGTHNEYVKQQLVETIFNLPAEDFKKIVIAYEPIWAIGTGVTASSEQAQDMHANIRAAITAKFGAEIAEGTSILYGGSCNAKNAKELFANKDVDGGLIGGASLKAEDFIQIINGFQKI
ncbi:MAG TPA: triose-phosphate isomerase [Draconibacterium sp.]|jgi:triosephosphate isomerase|nr:triose-phosphate isomerase [Draconibacterium sp.]